MSTIHDQRLIYVTTRMFVLVRKAPTAMYHIRRAHIVRVSRIAHRESYQLSQATMSKHTLTVHGPASPSYSGTVLGCECSPSRCTS